MVKCQLLLFHTLNILLLLFRLQLKYNIMLLLLGVCNTDNFSLLSITIDYGPFGFMDDYDPGNTVCRLQYKLFYTCNPQGGAVASWLVHPSLDWAVRVWALAGDIALCSWVRHFTLTVSLSTQVYKWVLANLMVGVTASHPGGTRNTPSHFMLQKPG